MHNFKIKIIVLFIYLLCLIPKVYAAEILQISNSSVLLIGDNNRTYTVKIACAEVDPELEERSVKWLKKQLPRNSKVNLRPRGSLQGLLVANVIPFNSKIDISEKYFNEGGCFLKKSNMTS